MQFIYSLVLIICSETTRTKATPTTVQIGVLFDPKSTDFNSVKRAFDYAVQITNASESMIKIDPIVNFTDIADNYALSDSICYQTEQMVFTLIGVGNTNTLELIESYCQALQMPFIMPSCYRRSDPKRYKYTICMNPSYIKPMADFIAFFHWKRIYYLYDTDDGLWRLQQLYEELSKPKQHVSLVAKLVPNPSFAYDVLRTVDKMDKWIEKIIILDMSSKNVTTLILRQVIDVGMNREGYHYIIGGLDIASYNLSIFRHGGSNISGFQLLDSKSNILQRFTKKWNVRSRIQGHIIPEFTKRLIEGFIKDEIELKVQAALAADGIALLTTTLNKIWNNRNMRDTFFRTRRGVFCNTNETCGVECRSSPFIPFINGPIILEALKNETFNALSGKISFDKDGRRTDYHLKLYHMGKTKPLENRTLDEIGSWTTNRGLQLPKKFGRPPESTKPKDDNRAMIVTTVLEKPFIQRKITNISNGMAEYEGYAVDLLDLIKKSKYIKFNYTIRPREDEIYGVKQNDTWNGMMGEIISEEADIAIGPITITEERQEMVDFTKPFMNTGLSIMIKRPDKQKPGVFSFKEPLANSVWLCITAGFIGVSLILFFVGRFSPYEWSENSTNGPSEDFNFLNSLWSSLGALMQQGSDIFPRSISGRVAESAWWFFTLIIVSSYTANLAAFLTIENLKIPINSVDDLLRQDKIKYGIKSGGSTQAFFQESKVFTYSQLWKQMVNVGSNEKGWEKVKISKGTYAFIVESASNEYFNQRKPCTTMKVGENINSIGYGIMTKKRSKMSEAINLAVLEARERGELIKLEQKWWYDKGQCGIVASDKGKRSLSLSNVSGIFHILIGGLVLAMLISICEYILHRKLKRRRKCRLQDNTCQQTRVSKSENKGERQPLRTTNVNGAQENKGYQTAAPNNLIMFESITENGQTQL